MESWSFKLRPSPLIFIKVVITDYPDQELVDNLDFNSKHCTFLEGSDCQVLTEVCLALDLEFLLLN